MLPLTSRATGLDATQTEPATGKAAAGPAGRPPEEFMLRYPGRALLRPEGQDERRLASIKQRLRAFAASRCQPLDDEEFCKVLAEFGPLTREDWNAVYDDWTGTQKPVISKGDLARIISDKVASLWAFDAQYAVSSRRVGSNSPAKREIERSVIVRDKYYLKREILSPETGQPERVVVLSFDSGLARDYHNEGHPIGSISKQDHANGFIDPEGLLASSMLAAWKRSNNSHDYMSDLPALLSRPGTTVLSRTWVVGGEKCIKVVFGSSLVVYLSVNKDFAVVRAALSTPKKLADGRFEMPLTTVDVRTCGKFENCGEGFWFPHEIKWEHYDNGKLERTTDVAVRHVAINHPVGDSLFRDIFPGGTAIHDGINNVFYVSGRDSSTKGRLPKSNE
jgi:hypothetical protein